ncbi:fibronectin type III domain-containing protein, partial [Micromonospora zhanjiangensis]
PGAYPAGPAQPATDAAPARGAGRNTRLFAVVGGVVVVLALVVAGVLVLVNQAGKPGPGPTANGKPGVGGDPPDNLKLIDRQSSITVHWSDPASGGVPFIVAGGQAGQKLGALATLDPGRTEYTVNGLNPRLNYCFTVLAVYSADTYATSGQICTNRPSSPPR